MIDSSNELQDIGKKFLTSGLSRFKNALTKTDSSSKDKNLKQLQEKQNLQESVQFYKNNSASIEVVREKKLNKIYFNMVPYCHLLPEAFKTEFDQNVDRTSVKIKVNNLFVLHQEMIELCEQEEIVFNLIQKNALVKVLTNNVELWRNLAFYMSIIINAYIFVEYTHIKQKQDPNYQFAQGEKTAWDTQEIIVKVMLYIMTISSQMIVLDFLLKKAPLIFKKSLKAALNEIDQKYDKRQEKPILIKIINFVKIMLYVIIQLVQCLELVYQLAYGIVAIFAQVFDYLFLVFHLSEVFQRYPTLKNVLRAVTKSKDQLILTLLLWLIIQYIFTIQAFLFIHNDFIGEQKCNILWRCYILIVDQTFKTNGGIGGFLTSNTLDQNQPINYTLQRFFFDVLFTLIINLILVAIIAGIIIDTFGLLRDQENTIIEDIKNYCFICGLQKEQFDALSGPNAGFQYHINEDHYKWNYLFFIAYLKNKDESDHNGNETFIYDKVKQTDISWFPYNQALSIQYNVDENEEAQLQNQIENQLQIVNEIKNNIKQLTSSTDNLIQNVKMAKK